MFVLYSIDTVTNSHTENYETLEEAVLSIRQMWREDDSKCLFRVADDDTGTTVAMLFRLSDPAMCLTVYPENGRVGEEYGKREVHRCLYLKNNDGEFVASSITDLSTGETRIYDDRGKLREIETCASPDDLSVEIKSFDSDGNLSYLRVRNVVG